MNSLKGKHTHTIKQNNPSEKRGFVEPEADSASLSSVILEKEVFVVE